jgi:hypothetical protein
MATTPARLTDGPWFRFSSYELHRGYIRPSRGATLEGFDPWEEYRTTKTRKRGQPPYQSLFVLIDSLRDEEDISDYYPRWLYHPENMPPGGDRKILNWCRRFGLLGLLPQMVRRFEVGPHWVAGNDKWVERVEYERVGTKWHPNMRWHPAGRADAKALWKTSPLPKFPRSGRRVPRSHAEYDLPMAYIGNALNGGPYEDQAVPVNTLAELFFPARVDTDARPFDCPMPGTQGFARVYCEPLRHFLDQAYWLRSFGGMLLSQSSEWRFPEVLERYLQPLTVRLQFDVRGNLREYWSSPSLLCSFAWMLVQDVLDGRDMRRCECCGAPFLTDRYQSRYCSVPCGWKHRKRRARASVGASSKA